jgi:transposase InsO family protein
VAIKRRIDARAPLLKRHGLITPQPQKRPRSSFIRFVAKLPNETWQIDATPWQLADGRPVEILNFVDDHSRLFLASRAFPTVRAGDVVDTFHAAAREFDLPASLLSDNAAVFTGRARRGKVLLELELARLGVQHKHSSTYHPQTCGKVERLHQTLKRFLTKQPPPPPWPTSSASWTPSATTTTTAGPTAPSTDKALPWSSAAASRPVPPSAQRLSTTASAATRSKALAS